MRLHLGTSQGDGYRIMRLHFADNSDERGQYAMLIDEGCTATLASYHYLKQATAAREFAKLWEEQVRLHLVVDTGANGGMQCEAINDARYGSHLLSYVEAKTDERKHSRLWGDQMNLHLTSTHGGREITDALGGEDQDKHLLSNSYRGQEKWFSPVWQREDLRPRVLIDSGAFTAWSSGKPIRPEDYGEWALKFAVRWREKMASLYFINLDVIGDQIATWKNQEKLEKMGLAPIPVVTQGAEKKHLEHALERYDYICLGGLVPLAMQRKKLRAWLDYCFATVMRYREKQGRLTKVHLLGVTQAWVLNRYPCYSTDSSAWTKPLRFGHGDRAGIKRKLPKYKNGKPELAATLNSLRAEIRYFKQMEEDATKLWASRGITFEEEAGTLCPTA